MLEGVREGRVSDMLGLRLDLRVKVRGASDGVAPGGGEVESSLVGGGGCGGCWSLGRV